MTKSLFFVSGLGRCGTTMTMQMLAAGGVPCWGRAPAYEDAQVPRDIRLGKVDHLRGKACKWLYIGSAAAELNWKFTPAFAIVMLRDPEEQARSQLKMLRLTGEAGAEDTRSNRRAMVALIKRDIEAFYAQLQRVGVTFVVQSFEAAIERPEDFAQRLTTLVHKKLGLGFDTDAARGVVLSRGPACLPDLRVEMGQLANTGGRWG